MDQGSVVGSPGLYRPSNFRQNNNNQLFNNELGNNQDFQYPSISGEDGAKIQSSKTKFDNQNFNGFQRDNAMGSSHTLMQYNYSTGNLNENNGNVMMSVRITRANEMQKQQQFDEGEINKDLSLKQNFMIGSTGYKNKNRPKRTFKIDIPKTQFKETGLNSINRQTLGDIKLGHQTQRIIHPQKIMIDRDRIVTHRKLQNRYSSLKELELKYIDILVPVVKDKQFIKRVKLNADSMNDIQSKFCIQSMRNLRASLDDSFRSTEENIKVPKTNELKKMKDLINMERMKGSKQVNWNTNQIIRHLRYPDNIIHKKQSLTALIVPLKNLKQLKQQKNSNQTSQQSSLNVTARHINKDQVKKNNSQLMNLNSSNDAKNFRVRFVAVKNELDPTKFEADSQQIPSLNFNPMRFEPISPTRLIFKQKQLLTQQMKLSENDNDKLDENMRKGEYLPERRFFMSQKKASLATQNQIKIYLSQKRKESFQFQKPNLFLDWQNKQQEKRQFTVSKIDNGKNSISQLSKLNE